MESAHVMYDIMLRMMLLSCREGLGVVHANVLNSDNRYLACCRCTNMLFGPIRFIRCW